MQQDTKNKFAAILAAAQAKANINPNFTTSEESKAQIKPIQTEPAQTKPIVQPSPIVPAMPVKPAPVTIPAPVHTPIKTETLPNFEFPDDTKQIVEVGGNVHLIVNNAGEIEEARHNKIIINDYTEKSIVLTGNTYPIRKQLKSLGAAFSYNFKCGAGWMFSKTRFEQVKDQLQLF